MNGTQVKTIFDPVVDEVIALVRGQIAATQKKVKAVLLVGGFGQNAYLRETVRAAIDPAIEVMQPPNGWTAVVRGALMKGLSQLEPDTERVKVAARTARKHYGTEIMSKYDSSKHAKATSWWYVIPISLLPVSPSPSQHGTWTADRGPSHPHRDDYDGELKVFDMSWFITKGSPVTEDRAFVRKYHKVWKVSEGPRQIVSQDILMFADPDDKGPPIYKDGGDVKHLARLTADLSCIPVSELVQKLGKDGKMYYVIYYEIEMTYFSAQTKYCLVYKQVKYDSVTAEYV